MEQDSEFYIGWQATAPPTFKKAIRRFVLGLYLLVPVLVFSIVYFQKGFSNGTFEYGKTTELEGVFTRIPVPFLTIGSGEDLSGTPVLKKILLIGSGKFGFTIDPKIIKEGAQVKVSGFLIYNDGKTAFEVKSITQLEDRIFPNHPVASDNHLTINDPSITLCGEITDPKCLLGVMNPGQGKPHRDCAIRCISGGLPPVLKVANEAGETEYYILVGQDGTPINDQLLDFVGDGVVLCGRLEQQSDWWVLYTDPSTCKRISKALLNSGTMCN
ncbi:MAG: hypothetical protein ACKV1O_20840 [Saprospiraceae bacterium]